jgi:hypothetical protein
VQAKERWWDAPPGIPPVMILQGTTIPPVSVLTMKSTSIMEWRDRIIARLGEVSSYLAIELIAPGGSLLALLLWLYRCSQRSRTKRPRFFNTRTSKPEEAASAQTPRSRPASNSTSGP